MLHEMGHVLGIGSAAWQKKFVPNAGAANPLYGPSSTAAVKSFLAAGGKGQGLPVEDVGSGGARNAHWKEASLGDELMSSQLTGLKQPLSSITISALTDLGYTVDASKADAFQVPVTAAPAPAPELSAPPPAPKCRNIAFAPGPGAGTQFVTGPCKFDNDCASGCCEFTKNVCRNALALNPNLKPVGEACKNGFSPVFDGTPCASAPAPPPAGQPGAGTPPPTVPAVKPPAPGNCRNIAFAPAAGTGTQFVTGPCKIDNDCASNCCEFTKNVCRNALALFPDRGEACKNGFSPVFDGPPCAAPGRRLEAEPAQAQAHTHAHVALRALQDTTERVPTATDSGWEMVDHPDTSLTADFLGPDGVYKVDMRALNAPAETSGAGAGVIAGAVVGSSLATLAVVAIVSHYRRKSGVKAEQQSQGVVPNPGYGGKY
jgi:hypothetical protein